MGNLGDVTSSATTTKEMIDQIKASQGYKALDRPDRTAADGIIQLAIQKPKPMAMYYLEHLLALVETPYRAPPSSGGQAQGSLKARNEADTDASLAEYQNRPRTGGSEDWDDYEEFACNFLDHRWEPRLSSGSTGGKVFRIDRSHLTPRYVKVKVKLLGDPAYVAKIRMLENAIEKTILTPGYILDLEFVDKSGYDVLTLNANSEMWVDAGNWGGSAQAIAHELHHALGLDDRYDYILSHAQNQDMKTNLRLYWFRVQMKKGPDPRGDYSLMGSSNRLLSEDVCAIGGPYKPRQQAACEAAQSKYDPKGVPAKPKGAGW